MSTQEISSDLVFEIVSRTPSLKTLDLCKTVSKEWNAMTHEANFMPLYCKRTKNVFGYFVQSPRQWEHISEFVSFKDDDDDDDDHDRSSSSSNSSIEKLTKDVKILASCRQGILCCVRNTGRRYRYYICKPTTGQWQILPNPRRHWDTISVAIMILKSSPKLRYKIVRLSREKESMKNHKSYRCDIFDSETWKWRRLENVNLSSSELITPSTPAVTVANSIYWPTSDDNVVEFREEDESIHKFPLPSLDYAAYRTKTLVEYRGRLGLICSTRDDKYFELWLKELDSISDKSGIKWRKKIEVDFESVENHASPVGFYNAGIAVLRAYLQVIYYKLQDSSSRSVKLDRVSFANEVFQFRSDFERVDLKGVC